MRDGKDAIARRDAKTRMRGVYVLYNGFKIVNMPKKYYILLIVEFIKNITIASMPKSVYKYLHQKKQNG